jgi:hypothetical protein
MQFNIFRDRYERKATSGPKPQSCVQSGGDWPELIDEYTILLLQAEARDGKPSNRTALMQALEGLKRITPSSPLWLDWRGLQNANTCALLTASVLGDR